MKEIKFKIRCSSIEHIVSGRIGLTEIQEKRLEELKFKIKLTNNQNEELTKLLLKQQNPELPEGVKTYCKDWLKGQIFERKPEHQTVYTKKGLVNEDEAIDMVAKTFGYRLLIKNSVEYDSHEFIRGTPDCIPNNDSSVFDVKNSWSWETFPLLESVIPKIGYDYQVQGYMEITGREKGYVVYCLTDTPDHLIEQYAKNFCFKNGYGDFDIDVYNEMHRNMTYSDINPNLRMKVFEVKKDPEFIKLVEERVVLCRKYINELIQINKLDMICM